MSAVTPGAPVSHGGTVVSAAVRRALPYLVAAVVYVIVGGALAAATAYVTSEKTAWATAYIVLVGGVAQAGLGAALGWLAPQARPAVNWAAFVLWNLGNIGVLAGQLSDVVAETFIGGGLLVIALVLVIIETAEGTRHRAPVHPVWLWAFRGLVVLLAVTIPIGLVLAAIGR